MPYIIGYFVIFALLFLNKLCRKKERKLWMCWLVIFLAWPVTILLAITLMYFACIAVTILVRVVDRIEDINEEKVYKVLDTCSEFVENIIKEPSE